MEIVTGHRGTPHVTPYKVGDFQQGIVGSEDYVLDVGSRLEAHIVTNNRIDIKDGSICMQGRHAVIPKNINDELTIENGMQGEKRIDLIVSRYVKEPDTGIESIDTFVIQGTPSKGSPAVPEHVVGDIRNGDLKHEMPLYEVELNGINVTEVRPVFKLLCNMSELQKQFDELNSNLIQSGTELVPNANGYFAIKNITFPVPYAEIPNVTATVSNGDNNDSLEANIFSQVGRVSKTGCVLKVCCWNEKLAGSKFKVSWIAVGRREL